MSNRFYELITEIGMLSIDEQANVLEHLLNKHNNIIYHESKSEYAINENLYSDMKTNTKKDDDLFQVNIEMQDAETEPSFDYDHEDEFGRAINPPQHTQEEEEILRHCLNGELSLGADGYQVFNPKTDEGKHLLRMGWKPAGYISWYNLSPDERRLHRRNDEIAIIGGGEYIIYHCPCICDDRTPPVFESELSEEERARIDSDVNLRTSIRFPQWSWWCSNPKYDEDFHVNINNKLYVFKLTTDNLFAFFLITLGDGNNSNQYCYRYFVRELAPHMNSFTAGKFLGFVHLNKSTYPELEELNDVLEYYAISK